MLTILPADRNNCGACWQLSYEGQTVSITAIDVSGVGFALSQQTLPQITSHASLSRELT